MAHVEDRWWKEVTDPVTGTVSRTRKSTYGKGLRYRVRFLDDNGQERSKSFPDGKKKKAENFCSEMTVAQQTGTYVDPHAGEVKLPDYVQSWLKGCSPHPATQKGLRSRLNKRVIGFFGNHTTVAQAATLPRVRDWLAWLTAEGLSENYRGQLFHLLSSVFNAAVEERMIKANPCRSRSLTRPREGTQHPALAWDTPRLHSVREALPEPLRVFVLLGAGLGLRQGEILGLSPDDIDPEAKVVHVRRQIIDIDGQQVFALPKRGKTRTVPLSPGLALALKGHLATHPARIVTLPWTKPDGEPVSVRLFLTRNTGPAWKRTDFNYRWRRAITAAGLAYRPRIDGTHVLRHTYASTMLEKGVSVRELADYLGHSDAAITLRVYTHLMPSSYERARQAIDGLWNTPGATDTGIAA